MHDSKHLICRQVIDPNKKQGKDCPENQPSFLRRSSVLFTRVLKSVGSI